MRVVEGTVTGKSGLGSQLRITFWRFKEAAIESTCKWKTTIRKLITRVGLSIKL